MLRQPALSLSQTILRLAAAGSRSSTGRSTSGWSGTGRSTGSGSCTGRSTSGRSGTGRSTAVASWLAATMTNLAATNLGQADLRAAQLGHLEVAAGLRAAGGWRTAAGSGWSTSNRSGTAWSTSSRSCTGRSRSGTGRSTSTAAVAAVMMEEQASVGTVDAGETNQRGGNPCKFHLTSPTHIGAVERERLSGDPSEHSVRRSRSVV